MERTGWFTVLVISAMGSRSAASSGARQLLAKRSVKFSPENLRVKNDKEVIFYPLSRVPLSLHSYGTAAPPFQSGLGFVLQKESPTQLAGHSKFSPYGHSERYATTIRTCFGRVFRNLYMSKVNFFHKMCQKPGIEPPTSLAYSFFLRSQAHHPF